jgi:hypothetical protein
VVNDKGEISLLNAQIESMFAYSRAELLGRTVDILVPDRFGRAHSEFRKSFMRTPQARPMAPVATSSVVGGTERNFPWKSLSSRSRPNAGMLS